MHFEILVEDLSGQKALNILVPKILGRDHTYTIHSYKGIGRIPKNLKATSDPSKRILLDQIFRLLQGYGKTFSCYPDGYHAVVIVVCDLDKKCLKVFCEELNSILNKCIKKPETYFCIAIEEGEAWLLGDLPAINAAYPKAKCDILAAYVNDDICGTWERMADALYPGGAEQLSKLGWQAIGAEKTKWATEIPPHMDVNANKSPSFVYFYNKLRSLAGIV